MYWFPEKEETKKGTYIVFEILLSKKKSQI